MKDIIIKGSTLKRELLILLIAFIAAVLLNLYAIISRDGAFIELFTQIGWTVVIGFILYLLAGLIRAITFGVLLLSNSNKVNEPDK